jgi:hypothetical protein
MCTYFVAFKLLIDNQKVSYHSDIISTKDPVTTEKRLRHVEVRMAKKWSGNLPGNYTTRISSMSLMNPK